MLAASFARLHGALQSAVLLGNSTSAYRTAPCAVVRVKVSARAIHNTVAASSRNSSNTMRFIDIGANLTDGMFQGQYMGKAYHSPDVTKVLERAWAAGVEKIIVTAGSLPEAESALALAHTDDRLYCTIGVHPTRCKEIEDSSQGPEAYWDALRVLLKAHAADDKVVAVGECGLDYDRLEFCDKETQQKWFRRHFELATSFDLPMFLHMRAAAPDFIAILKEYSATFTRGVVHSFDANQEHLEQLLAFPTISVGINGCSLKTEENLAVMAQIPTSRLLLETDSPYCDVRPSHAGRVHVKTSHQAKDKKKYDPEMLIKGRNEPCNIVSVFEVITGHRHVQDIEAFADDVFDNTISMFFQQSKT